MQFQLNAKCLAVMWVSCPEVWAPDPRMSAHTWELKLRISFRIRSETSWAIVETFLAIRTYSKSCDWKKSMLLTTL
jgi:hypothetical protein